MYKHECVVCLRENGLQCKFNISFLNRLLGTDKVKYCPEYINIINYQKRYNKKRMLKK
jgi:hypothetical protein